MGDRCRHVFFLWVFIVEFIVEIVSRDRVRRPTRREQSRIEVRVRAMLAPSFLPQSFLQWDNFKKILDLAAF
jgi:hypothetical protein